MKTGFVILCSFVACVASAYVSISERGKWPQSWPAELESLRDNARTFDVGTGIQQQIHEIRFHNATEFSNAWPALLKVRTPHAPVTLYWTNDSAARTWAPFVTNAYPHVRIYAPVDGYAGGTNVARTRAEMEQFVKEGKMLKSGAPWPAEMVSSNGALPEFVAAKQVNGKLQWVPVTGELTGGFMHRARVDLEIVIDGKIIDPAAIYLPRGTAVKCEHLPVPELTGEQQKALVAEARSAFSKHVRTPFDERSANIPEQHWGPTMLSLKPLRVVDDRVNIKIVTAEYKGVEAGFYINQPISSFAPGEDYFIEQLPISAADNFLFGTIYRYKAAIREPVR